MEKTKSGRVCRQPASVVVLPHDRRWNVRVPTQAERKAMSTSKPGQDIKIAEAAMLAKIEAALNEFTAATGLDVQGVGWSVYKSEVEPDKTLYMYMTGHYFFRRRS
jgi:hypothetical protein